MKVKNEKELQPEVEQEDVGLSLQKLRLEKDLTLEDVTAVTKISRTNLRAIESMDYAKLPVDAFVKGLVSSYAHFLGMNGHKVAEEFLRNRHGGQKVSHEYQHNLAKYSLTPKKLAEPSHVSSAVIASVLFIVIILSFSGFCLYTSWNPFAFITNKLPGFSATVVNVFHPADPSTSSEAQKKALNLSVRFVKECKVMVSLDDRESIQQMYAPETTAFWSAEKKIHIEFFQPGCAELQMNGAPVAFPSPKDGHYILQISSSTSNP